MYLLNEVRSLPREYGRRTEEQLGEELGLKWNISKTPALCVCPGGCLIVPRVRIVLLESAFQDITSTR